MPIDPGVALQMLLEHPRRFLERHPLRIVGNPDPSGQKQFYMNAWNIQPQRPGRFLRTFRMHATEAFQIQPAENGRPSADATLLLAHSIQMIPWGDPNNHYVPLHTVQGGAPLLVTGRLTGCSFVIDDQPVGALACGHFQPGGAFNGVTLHEWFLNHFNYRRIFGRLEYNHQAAQGLGPAGQNPDRNTTIVGVRRDDRWKIYAQKVDEMNQYSVVRVHRIWPA